MTQNPIQQQRQALPQHAMERIGSMRGAQGQRFFTSDLTVKEFLLVRESGFEAAGLVMGSSIYHVGYSRLELQPEPGAHGADAGDVLRA